MGIINYKIKFTNRMNTIFQPQTVLLLDLAQLQHFGDLTNLAHFGTITNGPTGSVSIEKGTDYSIDHLNNHGGKVKLTEPKHHGHSSKKHWPKATHDDIPLH